MALGNEGIGQAESRAVQTLADELVEHDKLAMEAFDLIGETVDSLPERPIGEISLSARVGTALLVRISNDLRCIAILARVGYTLQAFTLASALYEAAFTVAYLGADEELAQQWRDHDDPINSFRSTWDLTAGGLQKLGISDVEKQAKIEYKVYRQFCWAKHINPVLQHRFGIRVDETERSVVIENGPDTSEDSIRGVWFALEHAVALSGLALTSFTREHVPQEYRERLLDKHDALGAKKRNLAAKAKVRWPDPDPFPGRW